MVKLNYQQYQLLLGFLHFRGVSGMKNSISSLVVLFMFSIVVFLLSMFLNGWVIVHLWNWFLVPLKVMPIGILHACGLVMLVRLFVLDKSLSLTHVKDQVKKTTIKNQLTIGLTPLLVLLVGYVVHQFM